jgi:hypothetical protein
MKFMHATCVICGQSIMPDEVLISYIRREGGIQGIDLHGEQPWSGVRCACLDCVDFLALIATKRREYVRGT